MLEYKCWCSRNWVFDYCLQWYNIGASSQVFEDLYFSLDLLLFNWLQWTNEKSIISANYNSFKARRTFKILTTHFSLFVMLMASNTSEYLPRPSFLTTWKSSCTLKEALPMRLASQIESWMHLVRTEITPHAKYTHVGNQPKRTKGSQCELTPNRRHSFHNPSTPSACGCWRPRRPSPCWAVPWLVWRRWVHGQQVLRTVEWRADASGRSRHLLP